MYDPELSNIYQKIIIGYASVNTVQTLNTRFLLKF